MCNIENTAVYFCPAIPPPPHPSSCKHTLSLAIYKHLQPSASQPNQVELNELDQIFKGEKKVKERSFRILKSNEQCIWFLQPSGHPFQSLPSHWGSSPWSSFFSSTHSFCSPLAVSNASVCCPSFNGASRIRVCLFQTNVQCFYIYIYTNTYYIHICVIWKMVHSSINKNIWAKGSFSRFLINYDCMQ